MLDERDQQVLDRVADFLVWDRQQRDRTDEEVRRRYDDFVRQTSNPLVRHIVEYRLTVRTIVSALRRRRRGLEPAPGVGPWSRHIEQHWQQPDFGLSHTFPWIQELLKCFEGDHPDETERILLEVTWREWRRLADQQHFNFEAVILYLVRWDILYRWTSRDAAAGQRKFNELLTEAMGDYGRLYE